MDDKEFRKMLAYVVIAIVETVEEMPHDTPCPCGPMYMAMMEKWPNMSAQTFDWLCDLAVRTGKVKRVNHALYKV